MTDPSRHAPPPSAPEPALPAPLEGPRGTFGKRRSDAVASEMHDEPAFTITALVDEPEPVARRSPEGRGKQTPSARWVPPGETVGIKDLTISGGLIYVGEKLGSDAWRPENCLINPSLPVAKPGGASAVGLAYWCRYDGISPAGRRAYLEWLATGRSDPSADIACVFLYFYGLEYRLFKGKAVADGPALVAEVERLLGIYGANSSFQGYARSFIQAARLVVPEIIGPRPGLNLDRAVYSFELPLDVRVHLGQKLAQGTPLEADDALLWLAALPDRGFRTPVTRCPDEFEALWRLRFADRYPMGLKVSVPKARIKASYAAASSTFQVSLKGPHEALPDIAAVSAPVKRLRELVEACTAELDAYSRFVGKRPDARESAQAALLLPPDLGSAGNAWRRVSERCDALFANGETMPSTSLRRLLEMLEISPPAGGRLPQAIATQLYQVLDRIGIAIEPDRRYGGAAPDAEATVFLFRAAGGGPVEPARPEYQGLRGMIEIACLAAASDGEVSQDEVETILAQVRAADAVGPTEKSRLAAYALSIHRDPPKQQGVLKRLAARPVAERQAYARAALGAVMADDQATPAEVRFLERLHKALFLPVEGIYAVLHRGSPGPAGPGERREAADRSAGRVVIDATRLERIRRETQAVSSLLSNIFVEEAAHGTGMEAVSPGSGSAPDRGGDAADAPGLAGLDPAHAGLLALVAASPAPLPREAFDRAARASGLFPDGALEVINEWGFDRFDEALIEDGDPVTIAHHLRVHLVPRAVA
ncbi:hypothetical protein DK389_21400 [Methylobacterium durans]|uniref:Tellurite resistance protein TerB n=2 Tax=Methylobacterium durans TaxID=2202825 RepID=A0A2U8WHH3_9HYPH|nr:hypothetical protein DK389_21400 [Methylobacterium durans]